MQNVSQAIDITMPDTWAWDEYDMLLTGDEAAQEAAALRARAKAKQLDNLGMEDECHEVSVSGDTSSL